MNISASSTLVALAPKAGGPGEQVGVLAVQPKATVPAVEEAPPEQALGREPVEQAVSSIQTFVQNIRRDLNFALDDSSGRMVVKVTDGATGEVIRQMPTEEALRLAESLEEVRSLLFKAEA